MKSTEYEWQPIDTAPKDGSSVLLAVPRFRQAIIGYWIDDQRVEHGKTVSHRREWYSHNTWMRFGEQLEPSHWMPLPSLPCQ